MESGEGIRVMDFCGVLSESGFSHGFFVGVVSVSIVVIIVLLLYGRIAKRVMEARVNKVRSDHYKYLSRVVHSISTK